MYVRKIPTQPSSRLFFVYLFSSIYNVFFSPTIRNQLEKWGHVLPRNATCTLAQFREFGLTLIRKTEADVRMENLISGIHFQFNFGAEQRFYQFEVRLRMENICKVAM